MRKVMFAEKNTTRDIENVPSNVNAFDLLLPSQNHQKCIIHKTYLRKNTFSNNDQKRLLRFQNADTKEMILQWLANTQNQFQRRTQSQEIYDFCEDDNSSFNLLSVSQSNIKLSDAKSTNKQEYVNLQSEVLNLRSRKIKKPRSLDLKRQKTPLKKCLKLPNVPSPVSCNYNIEEFDTGPNFTAEMENSSIQKNIIQQMEDDFLNSIETEVDITKYNRNNNICESTLPNSGWDRMKAMKKSVCKGYKKVKKLKSLVKVINSKKTNTENTRNIITRSKSKEDIPVKDLVKTLSGEIISGNANKRTPDSNDDKMKSLKKLGGPRKATKKKIEKNPSENLNLLAKMIPVTVVLEKLLLNSNQFRVLQKDIDTEIIDLTIDSPQANMISDEEEQMQEDCEIIIKDISESNIRKGKNVQQDLDVQLKDSSVSKSVNSNFRTMKMSLNLCTDLNRNNDDGEIFLLASPTRTDCPENDTSEVHIEKRIVNDEFIVLPVINNIVESDYLVEEPLISPLNKNNINADIFSQGTQKPNDTRNVIRPMAEKSAIPLAIDRLKKLIQCSTNLEVEHKNILKNKLEDVLQLFYKDFKVFESVGTQTEQIALKHTFVQTGTSTKNTEAQTDSLQNLSIYTQTSEILIADKGLQTTQIIEFKEQFDFGIQVQEADLNASLEKEEIMNSSPTSEICKDISRNSQFQIGTVLKKVTILQDFHSSIEDLENTPEIPAITEENSMETSQNKSSVNIISATQFNKSSKSILTENILGTCPKDNLNIAICLTRSFSKRNSPLQKTQVESVGIISQTQQSRNVREPSSKLLQEFTPIESIGIISQTQINRSPLKLFKAKPPTQRRSSSPSDKSIAKRLLQIKTKSIEEAELSDNFDNIEYNTAQIVADGEISFQSNKLPNTKHTTDPSNIEISVDSYKSRDVHPKLGLNNNTVKIMKRIRFSDDTDSDEENTKPKKRAKNKFARDDLSIEFHTEGDGIINSDDTLPEELPENFDHYLSEDFNFEECIRKIENNFDSNPKKWKCETPTNYTNIANKNVNNTNVDDNIVFKSPVKKAKRSILSEIMCPVECVKSPAKIQILSNIVIQTVAQDKSFESDHDFEDIIYSDESFEENTKLRTLEPVGVLSITEKLAADEFRKLSPSNKFQFIALGDTPDILNSPVQGEEIVLAPPPEFANSETIQFLEKAEQKSKCVHFDQEKHIFNVSGQGPKNDSTVKYLQDNNPIDTSTQRQITEETNNYDILSLSPIKATQKTKSETTNTFKNICPLVVLKRDKPRAKPLNISSHSTPKVKQNSIYNYIKRTQNRIQLNNSSTSLFEETEGLMKEQNNSPQTAMLLDKPAVKSVPCIACSRLSKDDIIAVTSLVRKKLITFKNSFEKSVTHLIVSVNKNNYVKDHTMKYISAVSSGIWVLNSDWIKECIRSNEIVKEDIYEVLDVSGSPGPKESRLFRTVRPLLSMFRILTSPPFRASERSVIEDVVRNLGGSVVHNAIQFLDKTTSIDLVITEASSTQSFLLDNDWLNVYKVATVDIEWLSRSVGQYKTLSFLPFLLCDADEVQDLNVYPQELLIDIPGFTFSTQLETE